MSSAPMNGVCLRITLAFKTFVLLAHMVLQKSVHWEGFYRKKVSPFGSILMAMGEIPPLFSLPLMSRGAVPCHVSHIRSDAEVVTASGITVVSSVQPARHVGSLREWCNTLI